MQRRRHKPNGENVHRSADRQNQEEIDPYESDWGPSSRPILHWQRIRGRRHQPPSPPKDPGAYRSADPRDTERHGAAHYDAPHHAPTLRTPELATVPLGTPAAQQPEAWLRLDPQAERNTEAGWLPGEQAALASPWEPNSVPTKPTRLGLGHGFEDRSFQMPQDTDDSICGEDDDDLGAATNLHSADLTDSIVFSPSAQSEFSSGFHVLEGPSRTLLDDHTPVQVRGFRMSQPSMPYSEQGWDRADSGSAHQTFSISQHNAQPPYVFGLAPTSHYARRYYAQEHHVQVASHQAGEQPPSTGSPQIPAAGAQYRQPQPHSTDGGFVDGCEVTLQILHTNGSEKELRARVRTKFPQSWVPLSTVRRFELSTRPIPPAKIVEQLTPFGYNTPRRFAMIPSLGASSDYEVLKVQVLRDSEVFDDCDIVLGARALAALGFAEPTDFQTMEELAQRRHESSTELNASYLSGGISAYSVDGRMNPAAIGMDFGLAMPPTHHGGSDFGSFDSRYSSNQLSRDPLLWTDSTAVSSATSEDPYISQKLGDGSRALCPTSTVAVDGTLR